MILLLYMWENDPKGEFTGTMEDYRRLMSCSPEEAILVIQTLKEKKIFAWEDMPDGKLRIISRKQKKMVALSETRQKSGKNGGNPSLLNKKTTKPENLVNQKDKLNAEYENEYKAGLENDVGGTGGEEGGKGVGNERPPPQGEPWPEHASELPQAMVEIFMDAFPKYARQDDKDLAACLQLAYQIADLNGWPWQSALNGRMQAVLGQWREIVVWIPSSKWFRTKSLTFLNDKFQDLIQEKNNGTSQTYAASDKVGTSAAQVAKLHELRTGFYGGASGTED